MKVEKIILHVTKEDIEKSGCFGDCSDCIISTAAKRQFNAEYVSEGVDTITIDQTHYSHKEFGINQFNYHKIIKRPFSIELTKIC